MLHKLLACLILLTFLSLQPDPTGVPSPTAALPAHSAPAATPSADPLTYATYLGDDLADYGGGIAVDTAGRAYVTGVAGSPTFPTTPGAYNTSAAGGGFVTKLEVDGNALVYSTFLGGGSPFEIRVDSDGNAFVVGDWNGDVFVFKLDPTGASLLYSTIFGGSDRDSGRAIAVDASGNVYVTGTTSSVDFPTTPGAFDTTRDGVETFVTKLDPTGSIVYSTYVGGRTTFFGTNYDVGVSIAVDSLGSAFVAGTTMSLDFPVTSGAFDTTCGSDGRCNHDVNESPYGRADAFLLKLSPAGDFLEYATYLGGASSEFASSLAVDSAGNVYLTGFTDSADFPTTSGAFDTTYAPGPYGGDAFVTRVNSGGDALLYSTYLGGSSREAPSSLAVDSSGAAYVTGATISGDFPTTAGAPDRSYGGGMCGIGPDPCDDAFVGKLSPAGDALVFGSYLGGSGSPSGGYGGSDTAVAIAVDGTGAAYVTGGTSSADFPVTPGAFDTSYTPGFRAPPDAFVARIDTSVYPITVETSPSGLQVEVDGVRFTAPHTFGCAPDSPFTLNAPSPQASGPEAYTFESWSDGGARFHAAVCAGPGTVTATFAVSPSPDFIVSADPQDASLNAGAFLDITVSVVDVNGYVGPPVTVVLRDPPVGFSGTCVPPSVQPTGTCGMRVAVGTSVPAGTYFLTLQGSNGTAIRSAMLRIRVLSSEANFQVLVSPDVLAVKVGGTGRTTVTVTGSGGFSGTVSLTTLVLPDGVGSSFVPPSVSGSGSAELTIVVSAAGVPGTYIVAVSGDSGGARRATTLEVRIVPHENPPSSWTTPVQIAVGLALLSLVVAVTALLLAARRRARPGVGPPPGGKQRGSEPPPTGK